MSPYRTPAPRPPPDQRPSRMFMARRRLRRERRTFYGLVCACACTVRLNAYAASFGVNDYVFTLLIAFLAYQGFSQFWDWWLDHRREVRRKLRRHRFLLRDCRTPGGCLTVRYGNACFGCKMRTT